MNQYAEALRRGSIQKQRANRKKILDALPASRPQIEARTGLSNRTVWQHMQQMISRMHICGWIETAGGGPPAPVWALGPGTNAARPRPTKNAMRAKRWRVTREHA